MKILKARKIEVPADLAERIGDGLRDAIAEDGKLHNLDNEVMAVAMAREIKGVMESPELPKKPLSLARFSDMVYVFSLAYILGTVSFNEKGECELGQMQDISFVANMYDSDAIELRSGKQISPREFMLTLKELCAEDALERVYKDIMGSGLRKRRSFDPVAAYRMAKTILQAADDLMTKAW